MQGLSSHRQLCLRLCEARLQLPDLTGGTEKGGQKWDEAWDTEDDDVRWDQAWDTEDDDVRWDQGSHKHAHTTMVGGEPCGSARCLPRASPASTSVHLRPPQSPEPSLNRYTGLVQRAP